MNADVAAAYSATGAAWQAGPGRIYDRMAEVLVARCPHVRPGAVVLDLGAGTGAASRAAQRAGASVVALDAALGMLTTDAAGRPPASVGDAVALPFPDRSFDAVVAADAGMVGAVAEQVRVSFPDLGPGDLVAWRLGMAQLAPFVARLAPADREALAADALARLGDDVTPLVRSIIVLTFEADRWR